MRRSSTITKVPWMAWNENFFGEDGYGRWKNYDPDIVASHDLAVEPFNSHSEVEEILEVSARLMQQGKPVMIGLMASVMAPYPSRRMTPYPS